MYNDRHELSNLLMHGLQLIQQPVNNKKKELIPGMYNWSKE